MYHENYWEEILSNIQVDFNIQVTGICCLARVYVRVCARVYVRVCACVCLFVLVLYGAHSESVCACVRACVYVLVCMERVSYGAHVLIR